MIKTLYKVNWHYSNDLLTHISLSPIKVLREGILPGCSAVSITAVGSDGRQFQGSPRNYFETEEAAWARIKTEIQEAITSEEQAITEAQKRIKILRGILSTV